MVLSKRLLAVVKMVPKIKTVADIGCDHGKAAVWLVRNGVADYAICTDISAKSLNKARGLVEAHGLKSRIILREGDGFKALSRGEAAAAVIAGMGGDLIKNMLDAGGDSVPDVIILSCNKKAQVLRQWLCESGFEIQDEELVPENGKFYPVISARRGAAYSLTKAELEFGPVLLKKKPDALKQYVLRRLETAKLLRGELENKSTARSARAKDDISENINMYIEVIKCL
ncbi:MAG: class I SAM-dependent methyltransferase [Christensenellales bacterium]